MNHRLATLCGRTRLLNAFGPFFWCPRLFIEIQVAQRGGQDVVEIMRNAARQPPDGLHFLRLDREHGLPFGVQPLAAAELDCGPEIRNGADPANDHRQLGREVVDRAEAGGYDIGDGDADDGDVADHDDRQDIGTADQPDKEAGNGGGPADVHGDIGLDKQYGGHTDETRVDGEEQQAGDRRFDLRNRFAFAAHVDVKARMKDTVGPQPYESGWPASVGVQNERT